MTSGETMQAQFLEQHVDLTTAVEPLSLREVPLPVPGEKDVLLRGSVCGVCHTELDETVYPFSEANQALRDLKAGYLRGARVLAVH